MSLLVDRDKLVKEGTPADKTAEPFSSSKTSNWVARAGGLPNYIQHVAHAFVRKGMDESKAIGMAVGVVRNWAEGKGNVSAAVQAAAAKAIAQWEKMKAATHAKSADGAYPFNVEELPLDAAPEEFGFTTELFDKATMTTADLASGGEKVAQGGLICPQCGAKGGRHKKGCVGSVEKGKIWGRNLKFKRGGTQAQNEKPREGRVARGEEKKMVNAIHDAIEAVAGKKKKTVTIHDGAHSRAGKASGGMAKNFNPTQPRDNDGRWKSINNSVVGLAAGKSRMLHGSRVRRNEDRSFDVAVPGGGIHQGITGIHATNLIHGHSQKPPKLKGSSDPRVISATGANASSGNERQRGGLRMKGRRI